MTAAFDGHRSILGCTDRRYRVVTPCITNWIIWLCSAFRLKECLEIHAAHSFHFAARYQVKCNLYYALIHSGLALSNSFQNGFYLCKTTLDNDFLDCNFTAILRFFCVIIIASKVFFFSPSNGILL